MEKSCTCCGVSKPLESFSLKKSGKYGRNSICRECIKSKDHNKYLNLSEEDKEKRKNSYKKYYENNKHRIKQKPSKEYEKLKKQRQRAKIENKIKDNLRERVRKYIRRKKSSEYSNDSIIIGCSPSFLRSYLESLFISGMSWENYGEWHIDHIIPLSSANGKDELVRLCHYSNLQPLWAIDNLKKSNKI